MPKFWISQGSQYARVAEHFEYARICLDKVLNISRVLNMPGFWIHGRYLNMEELLRILNIPQYDWICLTRAWICLNMPEFTIIDRVLNMSHTMHRVQYTSTVYKYWMQVNESLLRDGCIQNPVKDLVKIEHSGKIIIAFNYFWKTLYLGGGGG